MFKNLRNEIMLREEEEAEMVADQEMIEEGIGEELIMEEDEEIIADYDEEEDDYDYDENPISESDENIEETESDVEEELTEGSSFINFLEQISTDDSEEL